MSGRELALKIRVLGQASLEFDGSPLHLKAPARCFSLLAYLALHPQPIPRSRLVESFWPERPSDIGFSNLRRHVHMLSAALPATTAWLQTDRQTIRWNGSAPMWCDARAFQTSILEKNAYAASVELYGGDLLPDFDDDWIIALREELRREYTSALERLFRALRTQQEFPAALHTGRRILEMDPYREDIVIEVIRLHVQCGDRLAALRQFHAFDASLRSELGVSPGPALRAAYRELDGESAAVSVQAFKAISLTSFHGRENELEKIDELLSRRRLISLVGPGGVGKTRLAVEALRLSRHTRERQIVIIELASVSTGGVLAATLRALGARQDGGVPARRALHLVLAELPRVILLDNCEHVCAEVAEVVRDVLHHAPDVAILVTSRAPLNLTPEVIYHVRPLPARDATSAAVALFIDRASDRRIASYASVGLDPIVQICQRLDGLPLAIELAAARTTAASPLMILKALDDRFRLLRSNDNTVDPRQRTLAETFAWSYELLSANQRRLFEVLSVFRGRFTLTAARALAGEDELVILDALTSLVEQSLVVADASEVELRYLLLETTRAFAEAKLECTAQRDRIKLRHLVYYEDFCIEAAERYKRDPDDVWLASIDLEQENIDAALNWAFNSDRCIDQGADIAAALLDYWLNSGREKLGLHWLERAYEKRDSLAASTSARVSLGLAALYRRSYQSKLAARHAEIALDLMPATAAPSERARALAILGNCRFYEWLHGAERSYAIEAARSLITEAMSAAVESGDELQIADCHLTLGYLARYGDYEADAVIHFEDALEIFQRAGKSVRAQHTKISIALSADAMGDYSRCEKIAGELLSLPNCGRHRVQLSATCELAGRAALGRNSSAAALTYFRRALLAAQDAGLLALTQMRLRNFPLALGRSGFNDRAATLLGYVERQAADQLLTRSPIERRSDAALGEHLQASLDPARFRQHYEHGWHMRPSSAIALALDDTFKYRDITVPFHATAFLENHP